MEKTKPKDIFFRLIKVGYVTILVIGIFISILVSVESWPYLTTKRSYLVTCDNGNTFDPESKPINKFKDNSDSVNSPFYEKNQVRGYKFSIEQMASECKYGHAWNKVREQDNFKLSYTSQTTRHGSEIDAIMIGLIVFVVYNLIVEIGKRTILYIFLGKKFI